MNIDGSNFVNRFWSIKGKDTLDVHGNYYIIRLYDPIKMNKKFQIEIVLKMSKEKDFSKLFFLIPKEHYSVFKPDFSNYREIEFDTIYSLTDDKISDNEFYGPYWSKRSIMFRTGFADSGTNYLRGILVERKDTIFSDNKGNEFNFLDRYLFVNEEIYVNE